MIRYKYFCIVILSFLSFYSFSNEKTFEDNKVILSSYFSFSNYGSIKINTDTNINPEDKALFKRIHGYLAVSITGIIVASLSIPSAIGFSIMMTYLAPSLFLNLFVLFPILFAIPFLAAGIPLIIYGFINYNMYKFYLKKKPKKSDLKNICRKNLISLNFEVKCISRSNQL